MPRILSCFLVFSLLAPATSFAPAASAQAPMARAVRAGRLVERAARLEAAGHVPGAMGTYREAVQVDPSFAPAYVGLARLYLARGDVATALEAVRIGRRRNPDDIALGLVEVDALVAAERADEALAASRALTVQAPRSPEVWWREGGLAREHGRFSRALTAYRRLLRLADEGVAIEDTRRAEARALVGALALLAADLDLPQTSCEDSELRAALCDAP